MTVVLCFVLLIRSDSRSFSSPVVPWNSSSPIDLQPLEPSRLISKTTFTFQIWFKFTGFLPYPHSLTYKTIIGKTLRTDTFGIPQTCRWPINLPLCPLKPQEIMTRYQKSHVFVVVVVDLWTTLLLRIRDGVWMTSLGDPRLGFLGDGILSESPNVFIRLISVFSGVGTTSKEGFKITEIKWIRTKYLPLYVSRGCDGRYVLYHHPLRFSPLRRTVLSKPSNDRS